MIMRYKILCIQCPCKQKIKHYFNNSYDIIWQDNLMINDTGLYRCVINFSSVELDGAISFKKIIQNEFTPIFLFFYEKGFRIDKKGADALFTHYILGKRYSHNIADFQVLLEAEELLIAYADTVKLWDDNYNIRDGLKSTLLKEFTKENLNKITKSSYTPIFKFLYLKGFRVKGRKAQLLFDLFIQDKQVSTYDDIYIFLQVINDIINFANSIDMWDANYNIYDDFIWKFKKGIATEIVDELDSSDYFPIFRYFYEKGYRFSKKEFQIIVHHFIRGQIIISESEFISAVKICERILAFSEKIQLWDPQYNLQDGLYYRLMYVTAESIKKGIKQSRYISIFKFLYEHRLRITYKKALAVFKSYILEEKYCYSIEEFWVLYSAVLDIYDFARTLKLWDPQYALVEGL